MNDLYLIGNGFDLAHGLKTSYNDFLLWYLQSSLNQFVNNDEFSDGLITITRKANRYQIQEKFESIPNLIDRLQELKYTIQYRHSFFRELIESYREYKWVDIEYEYFFALVKLYEAFEKDRLGDYYLRELKSLNDCFESIRKKLEEYLLTIRISSEIRNMHIDDILRVDAGNGVTGEEKKLFLYFNYTATMEHYRNQPFFSKSEIIYIHGKLENSANPVIFGYGDEIDPHYEKIENLNNNDFLRNIKSFWYFKTENYQKTIRFIESGDFTVKILGHSCGLSDRILLNTIFEHPNCKHIKIFHYEKSPTENDYFEKTQEISRHFKASKKGEMRLKIVPFDKYSAIPQNSKDN